MKYCDVTEVKKRKASPKQQDKFEFYSNKKSDIPKVYKDFGMSGFILLGVVLLLAAWVSVFVKEIQVALFPVFAIAWKVATVYTVISLVVFAGICVWYRNKHISYEVCIVYCKDAVPSEVDDEIVYVFQTRNDEQFTMLRSQFSYIPASFTVLMHYLLAYDTVNETYLIYQVDEEDM